MPIVFPRGVVEKIVEKVVEKIVYIAISLSREFSIAFRIVAKPAIPQAQQVASMILALTRFIYAFFNMLEKLKFYITRNPDKPTRATVGATSLSSLWSSEKAPKLVVGYLMISNPLKPTPQNLLSLPLPIVYGDYMTAWKPTFLFSIVSNPDKPPRGTAGVMSPSVGVRKSP
ncbi:MAG: hypothetical protein QW734_07535 [Candidatus Bathyarchaeia archaeon]